MYVSKEVDTCYLYAVYSVLAQKYHSKQQILTFDDSFPSAQTLFNDESLDSSLKDLFDRLKNRDEKSLKDSPIFPDNIEESIFFKHALPEGIAFINIWNIGLSRAMYYFLPFLSGQLDHNYLWLFFDLERDAGHFEKPPCYDEVYSEALRHQSDRDKLMIWRSRLYYLLRNIYYVSKTTDKSRCSIFAKTTRRPDSASLIDQCKKEMLVLAKQMNIEQLIDGEFHLLSFGIDGTHHVDTTYGSRGDLKTEIADKIVTDGFSKKESKEFLPLSFILLRNAFYKSNELYLSKDVVVKMAAKLNITDERFEKFCNFFISGGSIIDASLLGDQSPYIINKPVSFFSELDKLFYYENEHLVKQFGLFPAALIKSIFGKKDTKFFLDVLIAADLAVEVSYDQIMLPPDSLSNATYSHEEKFYYIPIASNMNSKRTCNRTALHLQLTGPVKIRDIQVPFTKTFIKADCSAKINFTRSMHYSNCTTYHLDDDVEFDLVCHGKEAEFIIRDSSGTNQTIYKAISDSCYELLRRLTSNENVVVSVSRFNFSFLCCQNESDGRFKFDADRHYLPYKGQTCLTVSQRDKEMWNNLFEKELKWENLPGNQPITTDPLSPHYLGKLAESLQALDDSTVTELACLMDLKDSEVLKTYQGWRRIMVMILEYEEKAGFDKPKTFLHLQRKLDQLRHSDISFKDKRIIEGSLKIEL